MAFSRLLFSQSVRDKLHGSDITVREASVASGVSASTISRIANDEAPDIDSFAAICAWLEADANQFLEVSGSGKIASETERYARLHHCLQELDMPEEMIKALIHLIQVMRKEYRREVKR